jgi:hypothetical protein
VPSDEYSARQMKLLNERQDMLDRKLTYPSTDALQTNSKNLVPSDEYGARQMKLLNERKDMLDRELTYPSTDAPQTNSKNLVPSDEYGARQMKLLNERKDMLDRELTYPSTDALQTNSKNLMPSDEYGARQLKLQNERKDMLDRKLCETPDNISSSGFTSSTPPSGSVLIDDRDTSLNDDNGNFIVSNYKPHRTEVSLKSQIAELVKKESEYSNTYTRRSRREPFHENGSKGVITNLIANTKKETGDWKDSLVSAKLKSTENGLKEGMSVNKSIRGLLLKEKRNSTEERCMPAINSSSRMGPIKREEKHFVGKISTPAVRNKSGVRGASLNNKINLDTDNVKHAVSNVV